MAAYIALFISLVSLILMIVILIRFKKLFSTDAIIDKTKAQMNRVIMDVNNNANRDLELINESSRRLRALLNEADKKMETFREATQLLRTTIAEAEKVGKAHSDKLGFVESERFADIKPVGQKQKKNPYIDPDSSYRVTNGIPAQQGSLFDEPPEEKSILKDETVVTPEGAAWKEVPVLNTKVYDDKLGAEKARQDMIAAQNQNADRSLKDKVERLFKQGMQIDDIAAELSCSTSEVQFIIDML